MKKIEDMLFDGINAQITAYGYATVICCDEQKTDEPSVENPYHLVYPASSKSQLKIMIERAGFKVIDAYHERRGYNIGYRVKMY